MIDLLLALLLTLQNAAQPQGLIVGSMTIPWSVIVTIAGGGAAWATLRADVRAARGAAGKAEKAAHEADEGIGQLNVKVGKMETELENVWRELDRMNRRQGK